MNGLFKIVSLTVPAVALVIFLTYHQQQEHKAEMRTESAAFDRDWNEQMAEFSKKTGDKAKYQKRAVAAQAEYSSQRGEFREKKRAVEHLGTEMNRAASEIDGELTKAAKEKR